MRKLLFILAGVVVCAGIVAGIVLHARSQQVAVTLAKVQRQDLNSLVSGTGQIKPRNYVNIGATAFGRITHLYVKEGDHVKAGQTLATIESVQPASQVAAQDATISSSKTNVTANEAAEKTAEANLVQARADLEQKRFDYDRYQQLYDEKLVSKQDYDQRKAAFDVSAATVDQRIAALNQSKATTASSRGQVSQAIATQRANYDSLDKTIARAPFDGLVTNVPVREGETMVTGIQNALGSTLMTLADMSVVTAEVKVDETDVVLVKLDQAVDVSVDAFPGKTFKGHVTEVGDQALLRTTGIATSQSTTGTEEAKDFKVVVTIDEPTPELRPGLSATAKIATAHVPDAVTIPIQSLVQRDVQEEKIYLGNKGKLPEKKDDTTASTKTHPQQGVYRVDRKGKEMTVAFLPIDTGVTGATEIEVTRGLNPGQEIVTGRFRTLRTLHSGQRVKLDTSLTTGSDN